MNLGKMVDVANEEHRSQKETMVVGVSPLSEKARLRLLERLTKVRDGYKLLLEECK